MLSVKQDTSKSIWAMALKFIGDDKQVTWLTLKIIGLIRSKIYPFPTLAFYMYEHIVEGIVFYKHIFYLFIYPRSILALAIGLV